MHPDVGSNDKHQNHQQDEEEMFSIVYLLGIAYSSKCILKACVCISTFKRRLLSSAPASCL